MRIKDHEEASKVGEEYLKKISKDVTGWFWGEQGIAELEEYSEEVEQRLREIRGAKVQDMLTSSTFSKDKVSTIAANIPMTQRGLFVVADFLSEVLSSREVYQLTHGRSYLPDRNPPKVIGSLTVAKPGVVYAYKELHRADVSKLTTPDSEQMSPLELGTVIQGRVTSFASNPELGGAIGIRPLFNFPHVVCGLVDSRSGEPNVGLELVGL